MRARASTSRAPALSRAPARSRALARTAHRVSSRCARANASPDPALASRVADALGGCSVTIVGDDEGVNEVVARRLAMRLGYSPVSVPALVASTAAMERDGEGEEGETEVDAEAAALVLENSAHEELSTFLRLVVATRGGGRGATARGDCWTWLFGSVTVWIDLEGADEDAPQRDAYELSEVRATTTGDGEDEDEAEATAERVLVGIDALLKADEQLCGKKNLYVRFGCRGDWPDLQPPGDEGGWRGEVAELEKRRAEGGGERA